LGFLGVVDNFQGALIQNPLVRLGAVSPEAGAV
jgi:hypothetical protein